MPNVDDSATELRSLADLTPDPDNARRHSARNIATIVDSLHEVGAARSIVIDENGVVLAGNGLIEGAAEAGIEKVRIVDATGEEIIAVRRTGLTDDQKRRLALFDNRAGEFASWDVAVLAQLKQEEANLDGIFRAEELDELFDQFRREQACDTSFLDAFTTPPPADAPGTTETGGHGTAAQSLDKYVGVTILLLPEQRSRLMAVLKQVQEAKQVETHGEALMVIVDSTVGRAI